MTNDPNKVALITGASQRIGKAMSQAMHQDGYDIVVHYHHSKTEADSLCDQLNKQRTNSAIAVQANFSEWNSVAQLAEQSLQWKNRVDLLINNASSFYATPIGSLNEEQWNQLIGSNAMAPLALCNALSDTLKQHKGNIINLLDAKLDRPNQKFIAYNMAKSALASLNRMLAIELAPEVRTNAISPGAILWPEGITDQEIEDNLKGIPLGKEGSPDDIVKTLRFILNEGQYLNGQNIAVDGGRGLL